MNRNMVGGVGTIDVANFGTGAYVNLSEPSGSVAPGDRMLSKGFSVMVCRVTVHGPHQHPQGCPIVDDMYAIEARCGDHVRWVGGTSAYIGSDLRAHWSR